MSDVSNLPMKTVDDHSPSVARIAEYLTRWAKAYDHRLKWNEKAKFKADLMSARRREYAVDGEYEALSEDVASADQEISGTAPAMGSWAGEAKTGAGSPWTLVQLHPRAWLYSVARQRSERQTMCVSSGDLLEAVPEYVIGLARSGRASSATPATAKNSWAHLRRVGNQ